MLPNNSCAKIKENGTAQKSARTCKGTKLLARTFSARKCNGSVVPSSKKELSEPR